MVATEIAKTNKPLGTSAPPAGTLQRLSFVQAYTKMAYGYAASAYGYAKDYVPASFKPQVESAENLYSKNVQPIVAKFADGGQEILLLLDKRVDTAVKRTYNVYYQSVNSPGVQNATKSFTSARDTVTKQFKDGITRVQDMGVEGSFTAAKEKAFGVFDDSILLAKRVLGIAQQRSQAVIDIGLKKSEQVHDSVVKTPLYKRAYDSSNNLIATAQDTSVYKETYKIVYPYVAPIADPAIEKIQPYYKNTVNYWKPVSAAA